MTKKVACARKYPQCTGYAQDGFKGCRWCRSLAQKYSAVYRNAHPEWYKEYQKAAFAKYRARTDPVAMAYKARCNKVRLESSRKWVARNQEQKAMCRALQNAITEGTVMKPCHCQDCALKKKPIVAWGVTKTDTEGLKISAWCCWKCWWARKKATSIKPVK